LPTRERRHLAPCGLELRVELERFLVFGPSIGYPTKRGIGASQEIVCARRFGVGLDDGEELLERGIMLALVQVRLASNQAGLRKIRVLREQIRHERNRIIVSALLEIEVPKLQGKRSLTRRQLEGRFEN